jgi:predicted ribosome quality control (RQC) complex YloA/Tae2 family protein
MSSPPPRIPDTFTFSQQLRHQLGNLALVAIDPIAPWERVLDLQFSRRPGEPALWHLYLEVMGKYSNAILANQDNQIITAAHQVSAQQSSVRPIQTGQPYEVPPRLTEATPTLSESFTPWHDRLTLVPGALKKNLLKTYRGLSSALVQTMVQTAGLAPERSTQDLTAADWQQLFQTWQDWLKRLETQDFQPGWTAEGYTVVGWNLTQAAESVQLVVDRYYTDQLNQQEFTQLRHQISQKLRTLLDKLQTKSHSFQDRLSQSDQAIAGRSHG